VGLESFLHPIAEELNVLAAGMSRVTVPGFSEPQVVQAFVPQFTTDMPAGDKLLNAIEGNCEHPGREFGTSPEFGTRSDTSTPRKHQTTFPHLSTHSLRSVANLHRDALRQASQEAFPESTTRTEQTGARQL